MSWKKQVDLVREKAGSIFEQPVIRLANLLEVSNELKDRNRGGCCSTNLIHCPETLVFEEKVDSVGDVHQVIDPTNLSMHAVQACNLIGQVGLDKIVPESPVELFVALPPVDKGPSKVLTNHFDLPVPLVAWCVASVSVLVKGRVRRASHRLVGERRCSTLAVYVDDSAQFVDSGVRTRHNCCMTWA